MKVGLAGFFYEATLGLPTTLGVEIQHAVQARKWSSFSPHEVLKEVKYWLVTIVESCKWFCWPIRALFRAFSWVGQALEEGPVST